MDWPDQEDDGDRGMPVPPLALTAPDLLDERLRRREALCAVHASVVLDEATGEPVVRLCDWHEAVETAFPACFPRLATTRVLLAEMALVHVDNPLPVPLVLGVAGRQDIVLELPPCTTGSCGDVRLYRNPAADAGRLRWFGILSSARGLEVPVPEEDGQDTVLVQTTQPLYWYAYREMSARWRQRHLPSWRRVWHDGEREREARWRQQQLLEEEEEEARHGSSEEEDEEEDWEARKARRKVVRAAYAMLEEMDAIPVRPRGVRPEWAAAGLAPIYRAPRRDVEQVMRRMQGRLSPHLGHWRLQDLGWEVAMAPWDWERLGDTVLVPGAPPIPVQFTLRIQCIEMRLGDVYERWS